jgi:nucleotide-binding universal stress UspA family protein
MIGRLPLGAIVVGVDGHPPSLHAAAWAAHQASLEHRPLVVFNGTGGPTRLQLTEQRATDARQVRRIAGTRHAERGMRRALEVAPCLRVETLVRATEPDEALLELGETARMLVVGSRGLGPIGSVVRGSVSLRVSSAASCPVVVVRDEAPRPPSIVVGTDGSPASSGAVEFGFAQASLRGVPLTVLHALPPTNPRTDPYLSPDATAPAWLAESVAGLREKYVDVTVGFEVVPHSQVVELVERSREADLVVVGARRHRAPAGLRPGSVSQAVIERAHCSIAIVHPEGDRP